MRSTAAAVGLEGCHCGFNATNSIRTCLFFGTATPPTFLTIESWRCIAQIQTREDPSRDSPSAAMTEPFGGIALFGEADYFRSSRGSDVAAPPIIAVENFTPRAQSLLRTRLPCGSSAAKSLLRVVVGHENKGVRQSLLQQPGAVSLTRGERHEQDEDRPAPIADMVVYVPQYGTISSLNVVTSLGIVLFYCYLDQHFPASRVIYESHQRASRTAVPVAQLHQYQSHFSQRSPSSPSLPAVPVLPAPAQVSKVGAAVHTTPRVDQRPIHPVYYTKSMVEIQHLQSQYRAWLKKCSGIETHVREDVERNCMGSSSGDGSDRDSTSDFGLSVLYENDYDQRNFGGLLRNANAFLVDHIFYVGRRKCNVVGAVGSHHYTPPEYLGPMPSEDAKSCTDAGGTFDMEIGVGEGRNGVEDWSDRIAKSAAELQGRPLRQWWMLDCGQDFLYTPKISDADDSVMSSSAASIQWYRQMKATGSVYSLCNTEASLRAAAAGGVMLLVPQEGRLPHSALLALCNGILTVLPHERMENSSDSPVHRGLPSQVASGIALQRLSAVLHPNLAAL